MNGDMKQTSCNESSIVYRFGEDDQVVAGINEYRSKISDQCCSQHENKHGKEKSKLRDYIVTNGKTEQEKQTHDQRHEHCF